MAFVVLSRALREAAYLAAFDASTLPYITGGVVILGLPLAALFSRALGRVDPRKAMRVFALVFAAAIAAIGPFFASSSTAVVIFYLVTAAGTVLLASGFWLIVSEMLVIREAKRLFGLISAGGTLGMLVTGTTVGATVHMYDPIYFVPVLVLILLAFAGLNEFVPRGRGSSTPGEDPRWTDSVTLIFQHRHLRTLATLVVLASVIGGLVDFQFKEAAQNAFGSEQALASFFGLFYGWTGGIGLAIQLLVTTRVMSRAGVAWSLAVLPIFILVLSAGMLIIPGLILATGLRGADSTLRKSLFRSVVEYLWVPVDIDTRRQTKTFVDTIANNAGDGLAALVVLLVVTLGGLSSWYLSLLVIAAGLGFLALAREMGHEYLTTLRRRLAAGESADLLADALQGRTIGPVTLNRIDLTQILSTVAIDPGEFTATGADAAVQAAPVTSTTHVTDPQELFASADDGEIRAWLTLDEPLDEERIPDLARLLARDRLRDATARRLIAIGEPAGQPLATILQNNLADFVVRRRIAGVLGAIPGEAAFTGLIGALSADRFEVRYRAARSLSRRRTEVNEGLEAAAWEAIRSELSRGRAVWELARLLDQNHPHEAVEVRATQRGELSLEHVFRLLSFVLDAEASRKSSPGVPGAGPSSGHSRAFVAIHRRLERRAGASFDPTSG